LQTRRGLQVDPLVRVALVDSNLEGYAVFIPGSAGTSAAVSTSFDVSSFLRVLDRRRQYPGRERGDWHAGMILAPSLNVKLFSMSALARGPTQLEIEESLHGSRS